MILGMFSFMFLIMMGILPVFIRFIRATLAQVYLQEDLRGNGE